MFFWTQFVLYDLSYFAVCFIVIFVLVNTLFHVSLSYKLEPVAQDKPLQLTDNKCFFSNRMKHFVNMKGQIRIHKLLAVCTYNLPENLANEGFELRNPHPANNGSSSLNRSGLNIHKVTHTCFQVTDAGLLNRGSVYVREWSVL